MPPANSRGPTPQYGRAQTATGAPPSSFPGGLDNPEEPRADGYNIQQCQTIVQHLQQHLKQIYQIFLAIQQVDFGLCAANPQANAKERERVHPLLQACNAKLKSIRSLTRIIADIESGSPIHNATQLEAKTCAETVEEAAVRLVRCVLGIFGGTVPATQFAGDMTAIVVGMKQLTQVILGLKWDTGRPRFFLRSF